MARTNDTIDDQERERLRKAFNNRVSQACVILALIIGVVDLAVTVLGTQDPKVVLTGLSTAVVLLSIALLQDHRKH